ncbi:MAG: alpha/beta hydrolase [Bacteroidota bacterium]
MKKIAPLLIVLLLIACSSDDGEVIIIDDTSEIVDDSDNNTSSDDNTDDDSTTSDETSSVRFSEDEFFSDNQLTADQNVIYATINGTDLQMDFIYPDLSEDSLSERPFIMLIHGGSFISGNREMMIGACIEFAKRGFVAATITYRLDGGDVPGRYKAEQDAHAALRYVVSEASTYGIDVNNIYVGGDSAGAIMANGMVFNDQREWELRDMNLNLEGEFGGLYSSGNSLTTTYEIKGVYNNWGSVYTGLNNNAVDQEDAVPTISFHGEQDTVVDIDFNASNSTGGSRFIHELLIGFNVCSQLNTDPEGGHGIYQGEEGLTFRVSKASCFFKSVMENTCSSSSANEMVEANCSV